MTPEQFLSSLERFIAREEKPHQITSDSASHFKVKRCTIKAVWQDVFKDRSVTESNVHLLSSNCLH